MDGERQESQPSQPREEKVNGNELDKWREMMDQGISRCPVHCKHLYSLLLLLFLLLQLICTVMYT